MIDMLCIPGKAIGKERARFSSYGVCYTPKKTKNFEALIGAYARNYMMQEKIETLGVDEPVMLILCIYKKIPTAWSAKKKMLARNGHIRPTKKPDASNVLKAVEDGMNRIAYDDDRQIVDIIIRCFYADDDWIQVQFCRSPEPFDFIKYIPKDILKI